MGKVVTSAASEADADDIWRWVANDSPRAADRLLHRFEEVTALLADRPQMGRARDELAHDLRSFPVGQHLVFYRAIPGDIDADFF